MAKKRDDRDHVGEERFGVFTSESATAILETTRRVNMSFVATTSFNCIRAGT